MRVALINPQQAAGVMRDLWPRVREHLMRGGRLVLRVEREKRSDVQNDRMWAMLRDVSKQVEWHGRRLTPDEWKDVFTASLRKLDVVPNLDSTGFVVLGLRTSRMTKGAMSDLIELMTAFGAERRIVWSDPALKAYEEMQR